MAEIDAELRAALAAFLRTEGLEKWAEEQEPGSFEQLVDMHVHQTDGSGSFSERFMTSMVGTLSSRNRILHLG
jgi:hypothetical protein